MKKEINQRIVYFVVLGLLAVLGLYLSNQRDHNLLGKMDVQTSNPDSLIRSYYTYDLMASRNRIPEFLCDTIGITQASMLYVKMVDIISENNHKILSREAPLLPENFWDALYKIKLCDCYWRGNFFDMGEPKYHVPNLKGKATLELKLADTTKCCNKQTELTVTDYISVSDKKSEIKEVANDIVKYYEKEGNLLFKPIDIPKDTSMSVIPRVSLFMRSNPSRLLNGEDVKKDITNQLEKLYRKNNSVFSKKTKIRVTFNRVTQSRSLILRLEYNSYDNKLFINRDFRVGHEVQALGYELSGIEIIQ